MTLLTPEYLEPGWFLDLSRLLEGDNTAALIQLLSMNVACKGLSRRLSDFYTLLKMIVRPR